MVIDSFLVLGSAAEGKLAQFFEQPTLLVSPLARLCLIGAERLVVKQDLLAGSLVAATPLGQRHQERLELDAVHFVTYELGVLAWLLDSAGLVSWALCGRLSC